MLQLSAADVSATAGRAESGDSVTRRRHDIAAARIGESPRGRRLAARSDPGSRDNVRRVCQQAGVVDRRQRGVALPHRGLRRPRSGATSVQTGASRPRSAKASTRQTRTRTAVRSRGSGRAAQRRLVRDLRGRATRDRSRPRAAHRAASFTSRRAAASYVIAPVTDRARGPEEPAIDADRQTRRPGIRRHTPLVAPDARLEKGPNSVRRADGGGPEPEIARGEGQSAGDTTRPHSWRREIRSEGCPGRRRCIVRVEPSREQHGHGSARQRREETSTS